MKKRFGISPIFAKDEHESLDEVETDILNFVDDLNGEDEFDQTLQTALAEISSEQDEKLNDADKTVKQLSALSENADQFSRLSTEMALNLSSVAKYVEASKAEIKHRYILTKENEELRNETLSLSTDLGQMKRELETARHEIYTLRKNGEEAHRALKDARESIYSMRHSNKKTTEQFRTTLTENASLKEQLANADNDFENLQARFDNAEGQRLSLKTQNEDLTKKLFETEALIEQKDHALETEDVKNQSLSAEIAAINRSVMELQDTKVTMQARLDVAHEELDAARRAAELDQRKHDNEVYSLRSEIDNISSQWRLTKTSAKDATAEARSLRERELLAKQRIQELEHELNDVQMQRGKYEEQVQQKSDRLRELNLQYESCLIELKQEQAQNEQLNRSVKRLTDDKETTQAMRIKYEAASDQIRELKSLISAYKVSEPDMTEAENNIIDLEINSIDDEEENDWQNDANVVHLVSDAQENKA